MLIYYIYSVFPVPVGMFALDQLGVGLMDSQGNIPIYFIAGVLFMTFCLGLLLLLSKAVITTFFNIQIKLAKQTIQHYQNIPYVILLGAFFGLFYRGIGQIILTGESTGELSDIYTTQTAVVAYLGFVVSSFITTYLRKEKENSTTTNSELLFFSATNMVVIAIVGCLVLWLK